MTATLIRRDAESLAAATPPSRDRYVDFLRAFSLGVVVLGHWLMAAVWYGDGRLGTANVLRFNEWAQVLTWAFQVMPLFFFVGGYANTASWAAARRDGVAYAGWLEGRLNRLVRPAAVFVLVWTVVALTARALEVPGATLRTANKVVALPLWFLGVYLVVTALAPAMIAAHRRYGAAVPLLLGAAAGLVDVARWGLGLRPVGLVNFALVWLLAHQLGVLWRDGRLTRRRATPWLLAGTGLVALLVLTQLAGYPVSLVGGVGQVRTNTHPPSLAVVAATLLQLGLALALRAPVDRWLARPRPWAAVVAANGMAMTFYLWHLTALVAASMVLLPSGLLPQPQAGTAAWWAWRPVWLAALALALVPLVAAFAPFERRPRHRRGTSVAIAPVAATAALLSAAGMTTLALGGFTVAWLPLGLPLLGLGLLAAGTSTLRLTRRVT
ncbi:MAG TPA: acyltransferase [Actinomycetes bacterium]|nr:acyltransferase [Actinomycetes bacterium]